MNPRFGWPLVALGAVVVVVFLAFWDFGVAIGALIAVAGLFVILVIRSRGGA